MKTAKLKLINNFLRYHAGEYNFEKYPQKNFDMDFIDRYKNVLSVLILFLIVTFGFAVHLYLFSRTEYVNGVDGGFYAYKTREIVEEGIYDFSFTKAPTTPPVLFLTSAFFAKFFGVFNGVKIATSLYSTLLGVSLFILTKYVTKSNKAGLIAAFFVIFTPLSLRIAADIRKNTASLFFTPLIIYFMLKFFHNWKYAIPLGITGVLGILSHNSIITMWFIFLAYLTFKLGIKGKLPLKEFLPIFVANLFIVILFLSFYDKVSSSLSVIATEPGSVYKPFFENLNTFILPLMITAVPGILLALKRRDSKNIFMLAWLILSFILTLSQIISSHEYWRFLLLMFVPVGLFVGYSFNWLLHKLLYIALPVLLVTGIITTSQFLNFGRYDTQMQPQLDEATLKSLEMASDRIEKNSYVYTNYLEHSYFWVRYYFGINTRQDLPGSEVEINELLEENDVYIMKGSLKVPGGEGQEPDFSIEDGNMETVYQDQNVEVFKLLQPIEIFTTNKEEELPLYDKDKDFTKEGVEYDFARFKYLSTYLILPYEIINIINPPYLPLWQIQLGFPLSLLLIGFVLSIPFRLKLKVNGFLKYVFVGIGIVIVLIIYSQEPSIFWGESQRFEGPPPPPPTDTGDETQEQNGEILDRLSDSVTLVDLSALPKDTTDYSSYKQYFVSASGNDSNDGAIDAAFATIAHALDVAKDESTIFVRGGIYKTRNLKITQSNFVLTTYENEEVTLHPEAIHDEHDMDEDLALLIDGDLSNVTIDGFTIENFEEGIIYGDPETQENLTFKNLTIKGGSTGIGNTYPEHSKYLVDGLLIKNVTMTDMTGIGLHCGDEQQNCAKNVLVQNVQIHGAEDNENDTGYDSLAMVSSDNVLVLDSTFTNAPGDALDFKATRVSVVNSIAAHPNRNGIKFWHEGEIINCISQATGADANIVFGSETPGSTFRMVNSVIAQHLSDLPQDERHAYAMTIGYDTPLNFNVELVNNIFYDMPGPIYINPQSSVQIYNNIFYNFFHDNRILVYGDDDLNTAEALNLKEYAKGNQYVDPLFADPTLPDWTLLPDSPAIDTGTRENGIPDFDIDWQDRPLGSEVDIGPYEKVGI